MIVELFMGPLATALVALTQIVIIRFVPRRSVVISFFVSLLFACLCLFYIEYIRRTEFGLIITNFTIFMGLSYCYFGIVNGGDTSVRVRILRELCDNPQGVTLSKNNLYNAEQIIQVRLERLTTNGQVIERNGRYYLGKLRLFYLARFFLFLKWLILGK